MKRHARIAAIEPVHADWFGKALVWGQTDCGQMVATVCRAYGLVDPVAQVAPYSTEATAYSRLLHDGHDDLVAWMGTIAKPVAPAAAVPGDILGYEPPDDRWGASLALMVSPSRAMALHPDSGLWDHCDVGLASHAWRLV